MNRVQSLVAAALVFSVGQLQAKEGTCGHNEMRTWVDNEEVCYHLYGPLAEQWNLKNYENLGDLSQCLDTARAAYKKARFICEMRGETPYRADGIHRNWELYRTAYKAMRKEVQGK